MWKHFDIGNSAKPVLFFSENQVGGVDPTLYTSDEAVLLDSYIIRVLYVPSVVLDGVSGVSNPKVFCKIRLESKNTCIYTSKHTSK